VPNVSILGLGANEFAITNETLLGMETLFAFKRGLNSINIALFLSPKMEMA
jgi:hypothetical protein